jgi:hypothetical protein
VPDDRRRRQVVPISSQVAFTKTGTKLLNRWGPEGLLTWILFLAACDRELVRGEFVYTSDDEAWGKLGARASAFELDEFFTYMGHLKQTKRTRSGRITYVSCRRWKDWQDVLDREAARQQKASKREENTPDIIPTIPGQSPDPRARGAEAFAFEDSDKGKSTASTNHSERREAVTKLLSAIKDRSEDTERIVARYESKLPTAAFHAALESLEVRRRNSEKSPLQSESRYVSAVLRVWVKEGRYQ